MSFPSIPNVQFKFIPEHRSGARNYAISSDGRVWIGIGNKWNIVKPFHIWNGELGVMLSYDPVGAKARSIAELMQESFGETIELSDGP